MAQSMERLLEQSLEGLLEQLCTAAELQNAVGSSGGLRGCDAATGERAKARSNEGASGAGAAQR